MTKRSNEEALIDKMKNKTFEVKNGEIKWKEVLFYNQTVDGAWDSLVACARAFAKYMNPHQTILITTDHIELLDGNRVELFEENDHE